MPKTNNPTHEKLSPRQVKFIDGYVVHFNGAKAARDAGYSDRTAKEQASDLLTRPNVQDEIEKRLKESKLSQDQIEKLFTDISVGDVKDYMFVKKVERQTYIDIPLSEYIKIRYDEIDFENEYAQRAGLDDEEMAEHYAYIKVLKRKIIKLELELEKNTNATRSVEGPMEEVEIMEFDLVAVAKDKERGKIKSYKSTKEGPVIEFYAADMAARDLARMAGMYKKDNEQSKPETNINNEIDYDKLSPSALKELIEASENKSTES